jgi:cation transport ATPase
VLALSGPSTGDQSEVLRLAAAAEAATRHPLSEAVLREAAARGIEVPAAAEPFTEAGSGEREGLRE